jgi:hypothetical protein
MKHFFLRTAQLELKYSNCLQTYYTLTRSANYILGTVAGIARKRAC